MTDPDDTGPTVHDREPAEEAFDRLLAYIESEYGFATSYYATRFLRRRIRSRLLRHRLDRDDYESYLSMLRADEGDERDALLDALSVNVTSFYRNEPVWDDLREVLATAQADASGPISAWSVPCSDGREPYSLAMLARDDDRVAARWLSIRASDIDRGALDRARAGVYEQRRTADIKAELSYLDGYDAYVETIVRDGTETFRVRESVRDAIEFDRFDLINDSIDDRYDLIVCRNFFIYLDSNFQQVVLEKLYESLRPRGFLVLGKTETLPPALKAKLELVRGRSRIYRRP